MALKGYILARLFELREELKAFLAEMEAENLQTNLNELKYEIHLAYLSDIFGHLNVLNLQLQGSTENKSNIFIFEDKLRAFMCKLDLWMNKINNSNFSSFPAVNSLINLDSYKHLKNELQVNMYCYHTLNV